MLNGMVYSCIHILDVLAREGVKEIEIISNIFNPEIKLIICRECLNRGDEIRVYTLVGEFEYHTRHVWTTAKVSDGGFYLVARTVKKLPEHVASTFSLASKTEDDIEKVLMMYGYKPSKPLTKSILKRYEKMIW